MQNLRYLIMQEPCGCHWSPAEKYNRTRESRNTERRLINFSDLSFFEAGRKETALLARYIYPDPPDRSPRYCRSLTTNKRSSRGIALLGLSSGFLMSSSLLWLNKNMELYDPSPAMKKVNQNLLARHEADNCR